MLLFDQIFGIATRKGKNILKNLYLFEIPAKLLLPIVSIIHWLNSLFLLVLFQSDQSLSVAEKKRKCSAALVQYRILLHNVKQHNVNVTRRNVTKRGCTQHKSFQNVNVT